MICMCSTDGPWWSGLGVSGEAWTRGFDSSAARSPPVRSHRFHPLHGRRWRPRVSRPPMFAGIAQLAEQPGERGHDHRINAGSGGPASCPSHSQALRLIAVDAVPGSSPGPRVFGERPMDDKHDVMDDIEAVLEDVDPAVQVLALRGKLQEKKALYEGDA